MNSPSTDPAQDALIEQWSRGTFGQPTVTPSAAPSAQRPVSPPRLHPPEPASYPAPQLRSSGVSQIVVGVVAITIGIGVTVLTYDAAAGGGSYIVAWGPVVYGLITLVRGLANLGRD